MKYFILYLLLLSSSIITSGQITVDDVKTKDPYISIGKVKRGGQFAAALNYKIINGDTTYFFLYKDQQYRYLTEYEVVSFYNTDNTLEKFYQIFKSVFLKENKRNKDYEVNFTLGTKKVSVSVYRLMGITAARFTYRETWASFTENEVDRLFSK